MDIKLCKCCSISKPISDFPLKRGKPNANCKICWNNKNKVYRDSHKEKEAERHSKYWQKVKGTEHQVEVNKKKCKNYQRTHLDIFRFHSAKYRASKLKATPIWADEDAINLVYLNCPSGYHVDHIIPLQGTHVSGLHVHTNLQYLSAKENIQKSNSFSIL